MKLGAARLFSLQAISPVAYSDTLGSGDSCTSYKKSVWRRNDRIFQYDRQARPFCNLIGCGQSCSCRAKEGRSPDTPQYIGVKYGRPRKKAFQWRRPLGFLLYLFDSSHTSSPLSVVIEGSNRSRGLLIFDSVSRLT